MGGVPMITTMENRPMLRRNKSNIEFGDRKSFLGADPFRKESIGRDFLIGATKAKAQENPL